MRSVNFDSKKQRKILKYLPPVYADVWRLMVSTGIRVGDAVSVRTCDIDNNRYLHYVAEKTGKSARVKLPDDVYDAIKLRFGNPFDYIFPSPLKVGSHISRQAVWHNIKVACRKAGVSPEGISPHSCRKHFAVETYSKDGLAVTMAKLQHSSPGTTYLYVFDDEPIEILRKRLETTEKQLKSLKKLLKRVLYAVDLCCNKLIGDDCYSVTYEGRKALNIDLSDLDGNIY